MFTQSCAFHIRSQCFLREFAPKLRREAPFPPDVGKKFDEHEVRFRLYCLTSYLYCLLLHTLLAPGRPIMQPNQPTCLRLAHKTRICSSWAAFGNELVQQKLPLLAQHNPDFATDIMLINFGCVQKG